MTTTRSKYGNIPKTVNGIVFDSQREARRYQDLLLLQHAGEIRNLELQPVFLLEVNGQKICRYIADFRYSDVRTGKVVVEDSKGVLTPAYKLKKKLMKAIYNINIIEV